MQVSQEARSEEPAAEDQSGRNVSEYRTETKPTVLKGDAKKTTERSRAALTVKGSGTGRRKEAVARVRLVPGDGKWLVNGKSLEAYFPNKLHQQLVNAPFKLLGLEGAYDVIARIDGGGTSGQAGALRLGVARTLDEVDGEANRPALKKAGFLTRDARAIERKKAGLKKARKAPQYSKR